MEYITCTIQSSSLPQITIALCEDGFCKKQIQCELKNVEEKILKLSKEYQVYDVNLNGNSTYTNKIAETLLKRGEILSILKISTENGYEIWVKDEITNEISIYCFEL